MSKGFYISKAFAVAGLVVTASAAASIVVMVIVFQQQILRRPPTPPSFPATTRAPTVDTRDMMRLPSSLRPESYRVVLQVHLFPDPNSTFHFTGNSTVQFRCLQPTRQIVLHSHKLNLTQLASQYALLTGHTANTPRVVQSILRPETQFLEILLDRELEEGKTYELYTQFAGDLADDLTGFYRSEYTENGEQRYIAATQMQPTDARRVFPCFDEPAMKAVFNITLIHPKETKALSNTASQTTQNNDYFITEFIPTPRMSTYLLAFVVCDFDYFEIGPNMKIWARPDAINAGHAAYAGNITLKIVEFFEDYYGVPIPLSKLDQIALPDFGAGAMENWGLITYRETALLYDPEVSSTGNKEWIATVISHELAHQWFGNLVTMKWWNDLWLNEGFATYVSYLGANHIEPTWNIKDLMVLNEIQSVFQVDSLATSHPLSSREVDVNTPDEISELFDSITYSKGAALLRMMSEFLSEKVFRAGTKTYLEAFKYNTTVNKNLWEHLQKAADEHKLQLKVGVEAIMRTWTEQMGYPVVTINTTDGRASQQHFLIDPETAPPQPSKAGYKWHIPMTLMKSGKQGQKMLFYETGSFPDFQCKDTEWLLANIDCAGYYRVNYDSNNWNKLLQQLENSHTVIPVINRAQLIDDAFNLARAKHINTTLALDTTKFLSNETEYIPWQSALNNLDYFFLMFDRSEVYGPLQAYIRKQVIPLYNYFENITANWTRIPDNHIDQYNQVNAISVACSNGVPECQEMASGLFKQWMMNSSANPIHPNLKSSVYCSAIAAGGEREWNFAWEMFQNTTVASERDKLRYALSCSRKIWILSRYLEYTLDPEKIRKMDTTSTINYIARNVAGQSLAWDFVRAKWSFLHGEYGGGIMSFGSLIDGVTQRFSTEFELEELENFKRQHEETGFGSAARALEQALERTKANIRWVKQTKASVLAWFRRESGDY
uniref:Aminopeptidase n=1 Tax=Lepisosteus oculatus TaxID=7918 RepID=W5NB05_LEPOC|nr:PREDICTED: aminopeptidase N-like [Lepisosteus oculatus]